MQGSRYTPNYQEARFIFTTKNIAWKDWMKKCLTQLDEYNSLLS